MSNYQEFLINRIFTRNDYGTAAALLSEIHKATSLDVKEQWRDQKHAFNIIGENAPMRDSIAGGQG